MRHWLSGSTELEYATPSAIGMLVCQKRNQLQGSAGSSTEPSTQDWLERRRNVSHWSAGDKKATTLAAVNVRLDLVGGRPWRCHRGVAVALCSFPAIKVQPVLFGLTFRGISSGTNPTTQGLTNSLTLPLCSQVDCPDGVVHQNTSDDEPTACDWTN